VDYCEVLAASEKFGPHLKVKGAPRVRDRRNHVAGPDRHDDLDAMREIVGKRLFALANPVTHRIPAILREYYGGKMIGLLAGVGLIGVAILWWRQKGLQNQVETLKLRIVGLERRGLQE
jgi:hypothetical protein